MKKTVQVALVLTAAGTSSRFATGEKKEFLPLRSNIFLKQQEGTVLSCCLEPFLQFFLSNPNYELSSLIVTIPNQSQRTIANKALLESEYVTTSLRAVHLTPHFIEGKNTRQGSVFSALQYISDNFQSTDIVLIHDAARPFVTADIIESVTEATNKTGAAVPVITPTDTQKELDTDGKIIRHLTRSQLGAVQTPQGFIFKKIFEAHKKAHNNPKEYTDDTEIWGEYVGDVRAVNGSEKNSKITFKQDMEKIMQHTEIEYKTGLGTDFHRLEEGRKLFIGGIEIPFEKGEVAHSDGDVLLHAITDSLLGAAGVGDIGELFPPSDTKWKDADSKELLKTAWKKVKQLGWDIQNIDCVIHMEKPKFLPWRKTVIESIATILECDPSCVFVKAKTQEGLGSIGMGNAISAQAICLLKRIVQR